MILPSVILLLLECRTKVKRGEEWVDEPTFVDVTLWGRTAEVATEYLRKGSPVLIEGRLKLESWGKDGQKRSKLKVVGERMRMLGSRRSDTSKNGENAESSASVPAFAIAVEVPF